MVWWLEGPHNDWSDKEILDSNLPLKKETRACMWVSEHYYSNKSTDRFAPFAIMG